MLPHICQCKITPPQGVNFSRRNCKAAPPHGVKSRRRIHPQSYSSDGGALARFSHTQFGYKRFAPEQLRGTRSQLDLSELTAGSPLVKNVNGQLNRGLSDRLSRLLKH
jgi:hypothetical protein